MSHAETLRDGATRVETSRALATRLKLRWALTLAAPWSLVVWTAMLVWSAGVLALLWQDYSDVVYQRFDLGNMTQAVWSTAHGRPLEYTAASGEQISRLAWHVDPILALLAPLFFLAPTPLALAVTQVVGCALGALPVYWLGRRHLGNERVAGLLALAYLAYPWLAWNALDAMHPVTLAIPLLLFGLFFLDTDRLWSFGACAVLAVLCGELVGLVVAGVGIWYWLARRQRPGLVIAALGVLWSAIAVKLVIPHFAGGPSAYYSHFAAVGGSPEGVLRTLVEDPGKVGEVLTSPRDIVYVLALIVPLAALPLLAPGLVLAASAPLLVAGLGDKATFTDPRMHYSSLAIPLLVGASIFGLSRLPARARVVVLALALVLSFASTALVGLPGGRKADYLRSLYTAPEFERRTAALHEAAALVPDDAAVSATSAVGSLLSERRYFYSVPVVSRAEWIVVEVQDSLTFLRPWGYGFYRRALLRRFVADLRSSPGWKLVFDRDGVLVFRRVDIST